MSSPSICFSNKLLCCSLIVFLQIRVSVIQMLPSAEIDDLPVVVKFVLQSVGDSDAFEVR